MCLYEGRMRQHIRSSIAGAAAKELLLAQLQLAFLVRFPRAFYVDGPWNGILELSPPTSSKGLAN